ncbi:hypothetical protein PQ455_12955 [Sphingomonas naphthae]|uniref:MarR family transcriptional regulator n=1 Tax=Sphingomonas naphthae TaxID=1813468 RepID=A0ABY7TH38_9SPHN|nr:hypothetical protein [Sphingomonas naphthae]WCT72541.1 hypothetical protein PQ455_12955 [Sphingomonas naphthae]
MNAIPHEYGKAGHDTPASPVAAARKLVRFAAARAEALDGDLFANPAWAIMLDLFIAGELNRRATVEHVGKAAHLSEASAARWFTVLSKRGMVELYQSPDGDGRRLIRLTERSRGKLRDFLTEWR